MADDFDDALAAFDGALTSPDLVSLLAFCQRSIPREVLLHLRSWSSAAGSPGYPHLRVCSAVLWNCVQLGQSPPKPLKASVIENGVSCIRQCLEGCTPSAAQCGPWSEALYQACQCLVLCLECAGGGSSLRRECLLFCAAVARAGLLLVEEPLPAGAEGEVAPSSATSGAAQRCEAALGALLGALGVDAVDLMMQACHRPSWWEQQQQPDEESEEAGGKGAREEEASPLLSLTPLHLSNIALFLFYAAQSAVTPPVPPPLSTPPSLLLLQQQRGSSLFKDFPLAAPCFHQPLPLIPCVLSQHTRGTLLSILCQPVASSIAKVWASSAAMSPSSEVPLAGEDDAIDSAGDRKPAQTATHLCCRVVLPLLRAALAPLERSHSLKLLPWGEQPADNPAPPEHPTVILFGALLLASAKAPSLALCKVILKCASLLYSALDAPHSAAMVVTALPNCPLHSYSAAVIGWVQRDLNATRLLGVGKAVSVLEGLLHARLKRGLLLRARSALESSSSSSSSSSDGSNFGGGVECGALGWGALLQSKGLSQASGALLTDRVAMAVSAHLSEEGEIDCALLCLLRTLLIVVTRSAAAAQAPLAAEGGAAPLAVQGPRELFPPARAQTLLATYAAPLMTGLVAAQACARQQVGINSLSPHHDPMFQKAPPGLVGGGGVAGMGGSRKPPASDDSSRALSSHFLLENALAPTIELLEQWAKA